MAPHRVVDGVGTGQFAAMVAAVIGTVGVAAGKQYSDWRCVPTRADRLTTVNTGLPLLKTCGASPPGKVGGSHRSEPASSRYLGAASSPGCEHAACSRRSDTTVSSFTVGRSVGPRNIL